MLHRQSAAWVPILKHNPIFADGFKMFLTGNPVSIKAARSFGLHPDRTYAALAPGRKGKPEAFLMAYQCRVEEEACDLNPVSQQLEVSMGNVVSLCDTVNSYQVMERLLPDPATHVSVTLQAQFIEAIRAKDNIVVVSTIDKMGKNLVYCKTDIYLDRSDEELSAAEKEAEKTIDNIHEIKAALKNYKRLAQGTHVKSILHNVKKQVKL